jgi:peptidoglycan-associated lipoprotein
VAAARSALVEQLEALVHFDFDKSDIKSEDEANLDTKAAILAANPSLQIQIAGNCDERGSEEYNLALGNRRALAAKRYLTNKGVDPSQITTISNGKERPIAMGHDESAWSMNRNDQFTILSGGDQLVSP